MFREDELRESQWLGWWASCLLPRMEEERKAEVLSTESVGHHRSSDRQAHILQEAEADSSACPLHHSARLMKPWLS